VFSSVITEFAMDIVENPQMTSSDEEEENLSPSTSTQSNSIQDQPQAKESAPIFVSDFAYYKQSKIGDVKDLNSDRAGQL